MKILITNDDGIQAPGIHILASELSKKHDIHLYAPAEENSGVAHAFTFTRPIRVIPAKKYPYPAYSVSGTPVDCVKVGCYHLGGYPDLIISGINRGANLGIATLYSGTVSAAMEGVLIGIPSIAVSCSVVKGLKHYESAAHYAQLTIEYLQQFKLPSHTMLNLNAPNLPLDQIHGLKITTLAQNTFKSKIEERQDPRDYPYYWLDGKLGELPDQESDNDIYWHDNGYATLTPLMSDLTNQQFLKEMKENYTFEME